MGYESQRAEPSDMLLDWWEERTDRAVEVTCGNHPLWRTKNQKAEIHHASQEHQPFPPIPLQVPPVQSSSIPQLLYWVGQTVVDLWAAPRPHPHRLVLVSNPPRLPQGGRGLWLLFLVTWHCNLLALRCLCDKNSGRKGYWQHSRYPFAVTRDPYLTQHRVEKL